MNPTHASRDHHDEPAQWEIRVAGRLDARWAEWFGGLRITHESDGTTSLSGPVVDQAALHGVLSKVRDLGLRLIAVTQVDPTQADGPHSNAERDHNRCGHAPTNA